MREVSAELTALERPDSQSLPVLPPAALLPLSSRCITCLAARRSRAAALLLGWFFSSGRKPRAYAGRDLHADRRAGSRTRRSLPGARPR